jgi:hypothetical protein
MDLLGNRGESLERDKNNQQQDKDFSHGIVHFRILLKGFQLTPSHVIYNISDGLKIQGDTP